MIMDMSVPPAGMRKIISAHSNDLYVTYFSHIFLLFQHISVYWPNSPHIFIYNYKNRPTANL